MDKRDIIYQMSDGAEVTVKTDGETVWLTQEQMCRLFGRTAERGFYANFA